MIHHLDFLIWMLLFPIMAETNAWIATKVRGFPRTEPFDKNTAWGYGAVWFGIGALLYFN